MRIFKGKQQALRFVNMLCEYALWICFVIRQIDGSLSFAGCANGLLVLLIGSGGGPVAMAIGWGRAVSRADAFQLQTRKIMIATGYDMIRVRLMCPDGWMDGNVLVRRWFHSQLLDTPSPELGVIRGGLAPSLVVLGPGTGMLGRPTAENARCIFG